MPKTGEQPACTVMQAHKPYVGKQGFCYSPALYLRGESGTWVTANGWSITSSRAPIPNDQESVFLPGLDVVRA